MEQISKPRDLADLFGGETRITLNVKGCPVRFSFREKDMETDLEYQRRLARVSSSAGKINESAAVLQADLWLFDKLCVRVERMDVEPPENVANFRELIPPDMKRQANFYYSQRIGKGGDEGN